MPTEETPIHELMDRDPLKLSEVDIDRIITELRAKRKQFNAGNAKAGAMKASTAASEKKAEAAKAALGNQSLGDLGL